MKPLIHAVTRVAVLCAAVAASLGAGAQDLGKATKIVEDSCSVCHGADGESASPAFPRLAGQHAGYIERQLRDYKSGKRKSRAMSAIIEDVSEADFKSLGAYFQSRATHTHPIEDAELAQVALPVRARQSLLRRAGLQCLPWRKRPRHGSAAAPGRAAHALCRTPTAGLRQA